MMTQNTTIRNFQDKLKTQVVILGGFVIFIWFLELIDQFFLNGSLDNFGVWPRTAIGLWGVLLAPILHAGFGHVMANTIPFLVLGWFVMVRRLSDFFTVSIISIIVSGLGIWLIAPKNTVHLGASGLIFGYFGYLLLRGYFERSLSSIFWSILVLFLYGGMIWGVLPQDIGISWQSHLFGFIGGGLSAYWLTRRRKHAVPPPDSPIVISMDDFDS